jgi:hypothetical protein
MTVIAITRDAAGVRDPAQAQKVSVPAPALVN